MSMQPPPPRLHPEVASLLLDLASGPRRLLGLVGPPGCGKSTLAALMSQQLGNQAQTVPMDGYHLAQVELKRLGRAQHKGAPDTFDAAGYAALLRRLRCQTANEIIYAPDFRRELEEPVAGALPLHPQTPLIITEGNYLLIDDDPAWAGVAGLLDQVWYRNVDAGLRLDRLAARHVQFGRTREQALAWIAQTDEPNARRIEACMHRAHRQLGCDKSTQTFVFLD